MSGSVQTRDERLRTDATSVFGVGGESRAGYVGEVSRLTAAELPEAWLAEQAIDYIRRQRDERPGQPFCLMVSFDRPHPPNVIPADYDGMYDPKNVPLPPAVPDDFEEDDLHLSGQIDRRGWRQMDEFELRLSVSRYLTNVTYVDACLGRVLTALDRTGYTDSTLVILLSDHGELLGERDGGHTKYCLYDSAVRVPLNVRWPGVSQAGVVSNAPVELVDLMPTWLEAAGLEPVDYLPGRSLRPLLTGSAAVGWRRATLTQQYAVADGAGASRDLRGQWTIREERYKLIHRAEARSALYDLQADPNEFHNLIDDASLAPVRDRLRAHIVQRAVEWAEQAPAAWEPTVARTA
jgi:arylsulfatase A-like enzyme